MTPTTAFIALSLLWLGSEGGRPRIGIDGVPDFDMPPNKDITIPKHITIYDDDYFWNVLKENDVVVMYLREQHCPDCDFYSSHFYNATETLAGVKGVSTGQIDIHDEGDIFVDWHNEDEDIPAILVFKTSDSVKYRKKPIQFVVNSRILYDLAPFVHRLLGPDVRTIDHTEQLNQLIDDTNSHSDGLLFTLWIPEGTPEKGVKIAKTLFERVAEQERYNTIFAAITTEMIRPASDVFLEGDAIPYPCIVSLETQYTPPKASVYQIPMKGNFKESVQQAKHWVYLEKPKRVGHKYDNKQGYFQDDLFLPANHSFDNVTKIGGDTKQYVSLGVEARSSHTKVLIIKRDIEFVTHENMTMKGIEMGVVGMSQGMKRMLVLPHDYWEGWTYSRMDDIHNSTRLLCEITVLRVGPSNDMPGRIEWEDDPEKIREYHEKSKKQDEERAAMIARGEDPDAQCESE